MPGVTGIANRWADNLDAGEAAELVGGWVCIAANLLCLRTDVHTFPGLGVLSRSCLFLLGVGVAGVVEVAGVAGVAGVPSKTSSKPVTPYRDNSAYQIASRYCHLKFTLSELTDAVSFAGL